MKRLRERKHQHPFSYGPHWDFGSMGLIFSVYRARALYRYTADESAPSPAAFPHGKELVGKECIKTVPGEPCCFFLEFIPDLSVKNGVPLKATSTFLVHKLRCMSCRLLFSGKFVSKNE